MRYDEDTLVQATTADFLRDQLHWESVYAYNTEAFGKEGTLGRKDDTEVILTRYLGEALVKLNWSRLSVQKFRVDKWSLCRG
jgi:type I restriction enzyme R subunit